MLYLQRRDRRGRAFWSCPNAEGDRDNLQRGQQRQVQTGLHRTARCHGQLVAR